VNQDDQLDAYQKVQTLANELGLVLPKVGEAKLDLLRDVLSILEKYPPTYTRGRNSPHSGEKDCRACGYPLTGDVVDGLAPHDKYISKQIGCFDHPCPYMKALADLKALIDAEENMNLLDQLAEEAS
jgi:hypothetical protein